MTPRDLFALLRDSGFVNKQSEFDLTQDEWIGLLDAADRLNQRFKDEFEEYAMYRAEKHYDEGHADGQQEMKDEIDEIKETVKSERKTRRKLVADMQKVIDEWKNRT